MFQFQLLKEFYNSGSTLNYDFRRKQLLALENAIKKYEEEINAALYADLKKCKEEAWATETGLLLAEIKYAAKNLHRWMKPKKVSTGLMTFPSSAKVYHDPLGVILIIAPWNYPLQLLLVPLVGAIAAGNCAVLKPSEVAPETEKIIVKIIGETFHENYIKVVTGDGAEIVPEMINSFRFDHIFYTGSTNVGREVYKLAANRLVPVTLELGGKSPCIVEPDADLEVAAKRIVFGKFINAGQTCIAPDYILVHKSIKEKLLDSLSETVQKFYTSDPLSSYDYGKIINQKRFHTLISFLSEGKIFYGGKYNEASLYIEPTILDNITLGDAIMKEEIFGPILPVLSFETIDEAIVIVQQNENTLAFYLFTKNKRTEDEWVRRVSFGGGCINNTVFHFANMNMPFGGIGNSGVGSYHGKKTFEIFSHAKPVLKTATWLDLDLKYPTLQGKLGLMKKIIG
ncbi:MAG: aldehyde dehydrogenase [Bacteroidota bacterium]|nr:aldehyde dehydrogenase [Bacteroidota bacterium]